MQVPDGATPFSGMFRIVACVSFLICVSHDADPNHGRYWLANALTPFVGDANSRTPEFKAFLVNLEKM